MQKCKYKKADIFGGHSKRYQHQATYPVSGFFFKTLFIYEFERKQENTVGGEVGGQADFPLSAEPIAVLNLRTPRS